MPNKFALGTYAIAQCDRCYKRVRLKELRPLIIKTKQVNIKVCRECWDPDHPQLRLGMFPVNDPQAVRDPRPDISYPQSRALIYQIVVGAGLGVACGQPEAPDAVAVAEESGFVIVTEDDIPIGTEFTRSP